MLCWFQVYSKVNLLNSAVKKDNVIPFAAICVEIEIVILSEVNQTE